MMKVMNLCPHEFDVALCGIKGKNVASSPSLVGELLVIDTIINTLLPLLNKMNY